MHQYHAAQGCSRLLSCAHKAKFLLDSFRDEWVKELVQSGNLGCLPCCQAEGVTSRLLLLSSSVPWGQAGGPTAISICLLPCVAVFFDSTKIAFVFTF